MHRRAYARLAFAKPSIPNRLSHVAPCLPPFPLALPFSGPTAWPARLCLPASAYLLLASPDSKGLGLPNPEHLPLLGLLWDEEQQRVPGRLLAGAPVRNHNCRCLPGRLCFGARPLLCRVDTAVLPDPLHALWPLVTCFNRVLSLLSCSPPLTAACALLQTWCLTISPKPACPWSPSLHWSMVGHACSQPPAVSLF